MAGSDFINNPTGSAGLRPAPAVSTGPEVVERPTNVRMLILALGCGISFTLYLHRYTWGFVKPYLREEFGWDSRTLGWLDGLFPASYGVGQIPSGVLCDWFGAHLLLGSSILLWSLSMAGVAIATGVGSMAVARSAFGLTQAGAYPVLNKVSKNWFPPGMRTTAQGLIATFFGRAGGALSFVLFGTVLLGHLHMPWRWAIGVFTLLGIACGVLFLILFRNSPRQHPWANEAEARLITAGDPEAARATRSKMNWGALARSRAMRFLCFRGFMSNMADVLYVYWIPLYLLKEKGIEVQNAGWMAALPLVGGAFGGLASGAFQSLLIRRTGDRRWARSGVGFTGKFLAAVFMLLSLKCNAAIQIACALMAAKFFTDSEQPAEWGTVSDIAGANAATAFACVNTLGAVAGFVASALSGQVLWYFSGGEPTTAGWTALFLIVAAEHFLAAVAWLFIDCTQPIDPPGETS